MLSPLDENILAKMDDLSKIFNEFEIDGEVTGFIIVFKDNNDYWSDNYKWFLDNCSNLFYIDRIVVSENHRKEKK